MVAKSQPGVGKGQCPYCKEWVSLDATRCPHCQSEFTPEDRKALKSAAKSNLIGCAIVALIPIVAVSFCSIATSESIPDQPQETAKVEAAAFYKRVIGAGTVCDAAFTSAGAALTGGDAVQAYRTVKQAESQCLPVGPDINAIKVPVSVGKSAHEKLTKAREDCSSVYSSKWAALRDIAEIIDEGGGVAKTAEVQTSLEAIQSGSIECVAGLMTPMVDLGVDLKALSDGGNGRSINQ